MMSDQRLPGQRRDDLWFSQHEFHTPFTTQTASIQCTTCLRLVAPTPCIGDTHNETQGQSITPSNTSNSDRYGIQSVFIIITKKYVFLSKGKTLFPFRPAISMIVPFLTAYTDTSNQKNKTIAQLFLKMLQLHVRNTQPSPIYLYVVISYLTVTLTKQEMTVTALTSLSHGYDVTKWGV